MCACSCRRGCSSCCTAQQTARKRAPMPCHVGPCGPGPATGGTSSLPQEWTQTPKPTPSLSAANGILHSQLARRKSANNEHACQWLEQLPHVWLMTLGMAHANGACTSGAYTTICSRHCIYPSMLNLQRGEDYKAYLAHYVAHQICASHNLRCPSNHVSAPSALT